MSHATLRAHLSLCKVSSYDLSSNFGAQGLRSWCAHFGKIPRGGPFLSWILIWCHVPLENLTACFDPNIPGSRRIDFLGQESWDTQPNCVDPFYKASDPFAPPLFDFLLGFSSASTCRKQHLSPCTQPFFRLVILTHGEDANNYMTDFWIGMEFQSCLSFFSCLLPDPCEGFCSSPSVRFAFERDAGEKTIALFVSDYYLCFQKPVRVETETTGVSFGTLSVCRPLKTLSHFPLNVSFLSFSTLGDWSRSTTSFQTPKFSSSHQYEVWQLSPSFEQLLDTRPSQSELENDSIILTCIILPGSQVKAFRSLITVHDPISHRNLGHRHSANSKWTNLRVIVLLHTLRLHGNTQRSCTQFVYLVRIGRNLEHAALRHLLFFGSEHACREAFPMQTHPTIDRQCHKFVNWFGNLNFSDPADSDLKIGCPIRKFPKIPFHKRNSQIIHHATVRISYTSMI